MNTSFGIFNTSFHGIEFSNKTLQIRLVVAISHSVAKIERANKSAYLVSLAIFKFD